MDRHIDGQRGHMGIPIPTYEEATSRPSSSQRLPATEVSDDAERQSFLPRVHQHGASRYRQPTVESARTSMASDDSENLSIPDMVDEDVEERRQVEELDYLEPGESEAGHRRQARLYHRARLRSKFSQHLNTLSATLGALRIPSFRSLYASVPNEADPTDPRDPPARTPWLSRLRDRARIPEQYKLSVPIIARLCALFTIVAFIWLLFAMDLFPSAMRHRNMMATMFNPESVRDFVQGNVDADRIKGNMNHLASFAHVAGSEGDYFLARWMLDEWSKDGNLDEESLLDYHISATYPRKHRHSVMMVQDGKEWTALLEEEDVNINQTKTEQPLVWHAYSQSGIVGGPLIYASQGNRDDFRALHEKSIVTNGTIALVRTSPDDGPLTSALKLRFAQEAGCVGLLVFNGDSVSLSADEMASTDNHNPPSDSAHRSSVALPNWVLGDPLSPGFASDDVNERIALDSSVALPSIPSLPLSWRDAQALLRALDGHGVQMSESWLSNGGWSGNGTAGQLSSPHDVVVTLQNENDYEERQKIWNLHSLIRGAESPEKVILLGAHRDSWCWGASSSASASAILMEVVNIFGQLRTHGWRPLRSLEFVSWDASLWNSAGSTEYVEDKLTYLRAENIAYLDIGGISGTDLSAVGSPLLQRALQHALDRIGGDDGNVTLLEQVDSDSAAERLTPLHPMGANGDYAPFTHIAGVSSLHGRFTGPQAHLVEGSCYDSAEWVERVAEPSGEYSNHKTLAQAIALIVLDLISTPLLPMDIRTYATAIEEWANKIHEQAKAELANQDSRDSLEAVGFDLEPLNSAIESLKNDAETFHKFEDDWTDHVYSRNGVEDLTYGMQRMEFNDRLADFEKSLLDLPGNASDATGHGLKDRPQFKHSLFAPDKWADGVQLFPTVWEEIEQGRWEEAGREVKRVAEIIRRAGQALTRE